MFEISQKNFYISWSKVARLNNNNSNDNYSNDNDNNNNNNNSNSNNKGQFFYSLTKISKIFFIFAKKKNL